MRSGELARLAGVTVRTLRHYHKVGVLTEPDRGSNGYRNYDVHDLIRLLRIKRLASLGISLDRMPALLDTDDDPRSLLDELDGELATQIDRLTAQRTAIAELRDHDAAPDFPPALAPFVEPFVAAFAGAGLPKEVTDLDRDHAVLVAHLSGDEAMANLTRFYARLSAPDVLPAVATFAQQFGRLGDAATDADVLAVVDGYEETFASVMDDPAVTDPPIEANQFAGVIEEYLDDLLHPRQRQAIDLIRSRWEPL